MTIKEIIELQDESGKLFLLRQGLFYRGYNQAAVFLHESFGYQVMGKEMKSCGKQLFYVGFPASALSKVNKAVQERGGTTEERSDGIVVISGIKITREAATLPAVVKTPGAHPAGKAAGKETSLADEITGFDLAGSTPMECMNFMARLQGRLTRPVTPMETKGKLVESMAQ